MQSHEGFWFCMDADCRNFWDPNEEGEDMDDLEQSIKAVADSAGTIRISITHGIWCVAQEYGADQAHGRTLLDALKAFDAAVAYRDALSSKYAEKRAA
jgi:hypothetical protein